MGKYSAVTEFMTSPSSLDIEDDNHLVGIGWMLMTMCLFVSMDAVAKFLTQEFSPFQVVWSRFVFHIMWLTLLLRHKLWACFSSGNLKLQLFRSCLLLTTTLLFFYRIAHIRTLDSNGNHVSITDIRNFACRAPIG